MPPPISKCKVYRESTNIHLTTPNIICFSECLQCVPSKVGPTCCGRGGSWQGKCGARGDSASQHTWAEGLKVCKTKAVANKAKAAFEAIPQRHNSALATDSARPVVSMMSLLSVVVVCINTLLI